MADTQLPKHRLLGCPCVQYLHLLLIYISLTFSAAGSVFASRFCLSTSNFHEQCVVACSIRSLSHNKKFSISNLLFAFFYFHFPTTPVSLAHVSFSNPTYAYFMPLRFFNFDNLYYANFVMLLMRSTVGFVSTRWK